MHKDRPPKKTFHKENFLAMNRYAELKKKLFEHLDALSDLYTEAEGLLPDDHSRFPQEGMAAVCRMRSQLTGDLVRIAVVGAIKSGKSTFVNALIGKDYLRRGAGVVTAFVTKLQRGEVRQARLYFKTWDEVNAEIARALPLLPDFAPAHPGGGFDIRRDEDRMRLNAAFTRMAPEQLVANGAVNPDGLLLNAYLKGYDRVRLAIGEDEQTLVFDEERFEDHRDFAATDALGAYLKDIRLEIPCDALVEGIEIADCQGSDSPNPLHLVMIQEYLNLTHQIVYVISSRTGLRRADIRFLSMIKEMGILDNILFVVNCDFSEHGTKEDLLRLVVRVEEEIAYFKPDAQVFAFSALLHLFRANGKQLTDTDRQRLAIWEGQKELTAQSDRHYAEFLGALREKTVGGRLSLLLNNQANRACLAAKGLCRWARMSRVLLSGNIEKLDILMERIRSRQAGIEHVGGMIHHALDGTLVQVRGQLKKEVEDLFENRETGISRKIETFIRQYDMHPPARAAALDQMGVAHAMYQLFQSFKQALDMFLADTVNPMIMRFVRERERALLSHLTGIAAPFGEMADTAAADLSRELEDIGLSLAAPLPAGVEDIDMETVRRTAKITLPAVSATLRYSAGIKTEAVLRLGIHTALDMVRRVLKKPVQSDPERILAALRTGGRRLKRETERAVQFNLRDYRENMKFQYFAPLSDAMARALRDGVTRRFEQHTQHLLHTIERIRRQGTGSKKDTDALLSLGKRAEKLASDMETLRAEAADLRV